MTTTAADTINDTYAGTQLDVLRGRFASTNRGISDSYPRFILGGDEPNSIRLVCRWAGTDREYWHAEPVNQPANTAGPMMGGNYVVLPSRVAQAIGRSGVAIPLHDRFETWADYDRLSR